MMENHIEKTEKEIKIGLPKPEDVKRIKNHAVPLTCMVYLVRGSPCRVICGAILR